MTFHTCFTTSHEHQQVGMCTCRFFRCSDEWEEGKLWQIHNQTTQLTEARWTSYQ